MQTRFPQALFLSLLFGLFARPLLANDNPIRKTYPFSIVEVIIDKPKDATVSLARPLPLDKIPFKQRSDKYLSIGTAWFSGPKQLLSAAHVFSPDVLPYTTNFYIRTLDGDIHAVDSVSLYSNRYDIISFSLKSYPAKVVPIAINKAFAIGDDVCAPGNALGEGISLRCGGQISSLNPEPLNGEWKELYFSTPVSPGNSGGPLLDSKGKAIGIVVRKIKGEDLNIALPFSELKKVKAKLDFFQKDIGFQDSAIQELSARGSIRVSTNTPVPVMDWMKRIVDGLNGHMMKMSVRFEKMWTRKGILSDAMAKDYFKNPAKGPYFTQIAYNDSRTGIAPNMGKTADVDLKSRHVFLQSIGNSFFFFVELAKGEKIADLAAKPKDVMDLLLKASQLIKRRIADEEIAYTSLGEPYETLAFKDGLDRPWNLHRWSIKEMQMDLSLFCTPRPSGLACSLDDSQGIQSTQLIAQTFRLNAAELQLGYYGTSRQWMDFLAMPMNQRPGFMTQLKMQVADDKLSIYNDDISFSSPLGTADKDDLVLSYSYGVKAPLTNTLFAASYYPNAEEKMLLTTSIFYRGRNADDKKIFTSISTGEAPFDGKVYPTKDGVFMSTETVAKVSDSCLVIGFVSGDNEKLVKRFKKQVSFDDSEIEGLAH